MSFYNFGGMTRTPSFIPSGFKPFDVAGLSPAQFEYYQETPQAVIGSFMNNLRQFGPMAVNPAFYRFASQWTNDLYGNYQGAVGNSPDTTFMDYINQHVGNLNDAYKFSLGTRPMTRPTRFLRR